MRPNRVRAQGFKWWQNEQFQQELALTTEQTGRLEEIFQSLQPTLKTQKDDARQARVAALEGHQRRAMPTRPRCWKCSARVESARGELSKSRTLLAFRMRRILTADQNVKFKALHEEWVRERRDKSNHRNHRQPQER